MSEMTEIILRLLWRFYPITWLTSVIVRALSRIASWLEDEASWRQLAQSPQDCAFVGGWLALAEDRLNELIVMKAMRLLKRRYLAPPSQFAGHLPARAVRTPQEILARLTRLIVLYHDHKRLYELRARKLQRLFAQAELQLEAIHHPVATTTTIFQIRSTTTIFSRCSTIPTTTIFAFGLSATIFASGVSQPIRAPPRSASASASPTHPNPQRLPARRRDHA